MSDPMIDLSDRPADAPPAAVGRSGSSRRALVVAAVAVVALLVGSGAAVSALYLLGWRPQPERQFTLQVILKADVTAAQKAAVESALRQAPDVTEVKFESKAEAYAGSKEMWKDNPEVLKYLNEESAPASFEAISFSREYDCDNLPAIRELPGVDRARVAMRYTKTKPGAEIAC